jgi:hypothetical protein
LDVIKDGPERVWFEAFAIIEKNSGRHTVNDWISFRIAGGHYNAG